MPSADHSRYGPSNERVRATSLRLCSAALPEWPTKYRNPETAKNIITTTRGNASVNSRSAIANANVRSLAAAGSR